MPDDRRIQRLLRRSTGETSKSGIEHMNASLFCLKGVLQWR